MKILVVSDTHGAIFESIIASLRNEKNVDLLIHCGDKYNDVPKLAKLLGIKNYYRVVGNCDYGVSHGEDIILLDIENKNILVTHGHLQHVKDGLDDLKEIAQEKDADIVLYGHTHLSHDEMDNNILYFNPGSTILPKNGNASYGVIEISGNKVTSRIEAV